MAAALLVGSAGCFGVDPDLEIPGISLIPISPIVGPDNPTRSENGRAGATDAPMPAPVDDIEAFAAPFSGAPGDTIKLHVSSRDPSFAVTVYRYGWYGGAGSRVVAELGPFPGLDQGTAQHENDTTGLMGASRWSAPVSIALDESWTSGVYAAKAVTDRGAATAAMFVVRAADDGPRAAIVFRTSDLTWQAYNSWGGTSLYKSDQAGLARAQQVTYDRPDERGVPLAFARYELPLLRTFEAAGLWIDYASDLDLHERPEYFEGREGLLTVGHSEYWTMDMRETVRSLRENGTNHGVFSGNTMYWQVRLSSTPLGENRLVTCFKGTDDPIRATSPELTTVRFRDRPVSRPEYEEIGLQFQGVNKTHVFPMTITQDAAALFQRAPPAGTVVPGVVSHEWDSYPGGDAPDHFWVLGSAVASFTNGTASHSMSVLYQDPVGGAYVFNAGSFGWAYTVFGEPETWKTPPSPIMVPWIIDIARLIGGDESVLHDDVV